LTGKRGLVIVVTGVPGVGKSTVARGMARRLDGEHLDLSVLAEAWSLITGRDEERDTAIVDLEGMQLRLMRLMGATRKPLIIEGHFAHDVVSPEAASYIFVLRRAPWVLKGELEARGYGVEKVRENVEAELIGVPLVEAVEAYGAERICEIDTTNREPEEVVEAAISIIRGDGVCDRGKLDWMGCAEAGGLWKGG